MDDAKDFFVNTSPCEKTVLILGGVTIGAAAPMAAGFGTAGIFAGSFAASMQGASVVSGSLFSTLQGLGAKGLFAKAVAGGMSATAAAKYVCDKLENPEE